MATIRNTPSIAAEGNNSNKFQNIFTSGLNVMSFAVNHILFLYDV